LGATVVALKAVGALPNAPDAHLTVMHSGVNLAPFVGPPDGSLSEFDRLASGRCGCASQNSGMR